MTKQFPHRVLLDIDIRGKTEWWVEQFVERTAKLVVAHLPHTLHARGTGVRYMTMFGWIADNAEVTVLIRHVADLRRFHALADVIRQMGGEVRRQRRSRARVLTVVK